MFNNLKLIMLFVLTIFIVWACSNNLAKNGESRVSLVSQSSRSPCRVIKHAMGETCVPWKSDRVIVLGNLDNILALDIDPIAATRWMDGNFPLYLRELNQTQNTIKVGLNGQPNLEKILYLKPDLILGWSSDAAVYDKLSYIAPTVLVDSDASWKEWLKIHAEALGKTKKAQQLLDDYEKRIELLRQKMGDRIEKTKISTVSFWADRVLIEKQDSFCGEIFSEIGLSRPAAQNKNKNAENVSLEIIPKLESDIIFLITGGHDESKLAQYRNHPLWTQLEAVQQNKVYEVDGDTWTGGWGMVAANRVLDDLFKYLID